MKLTIFNFLKILLLAAVLPACNKEENTSLQQLDMKNVSYGSNAAQTIDIYLPANRTTTDTKVVLFIHGGSWNAGDKADFAEAITAIRTQLPGYAIFNMNYRLANSANRFPAQSDDIQSALDFIKSKASDYKIDANTVGLVGASAGAHLALLQAYRFNTNGNIKAVVDLFGPTDLTTLYNNHPISQASQPVLVNLLGATPATNPTLYQQASPINYVTASSVPTLIFHGTDDFIVPINQSITLRTKLQTANVPVQYVSYTAEGHGWVGANLVDTYTKAVAFIKQYVK
ncbi:MAG: lipase [Segetibacter sp.]|nr:lipase [Segetibacter sp.]